MGEGRRLSASPDICLPHHPSSQPCRQVLAQWLLSKLEPSPLDAGMQEGCGALNSTERKISFEFICKPLPQRQLPCLLSYSLTSGFCSLQLHRYQSMNSPSNKAHETQSAWMSAEGSNFRKRQDRHFCFHGRCCWRWGSIPVRAPLGGKCVSMSTCLSSSHHGLSPIIAGHNKTSAGHESRL